MDSREVTDPRPAFDPVREASEDSFPASDPPAWTVVTGVGAPGRERDREVQPGPQVPGVEVQSPDSCPPSIGDAT